MGLYRDSNPFCFLTDVFKKRMIVLRGFAFQLVGTVNNCFTETGGHYLTQFQSSYPETFCVLPVFVFK